METLLRHQLWDLFVPGQCPFSHCLTNVSLLTESRPNNKNIRGLVFVVRRDPRQPCMEKRGEPLPWPVLISSFSDFPDKRTLGMRKSSITFVEVFGWSLETRYLLFYWRGVPIVIKDYEKYEMYRKKVYYCKLVLRSGYPSRSDDINMGYNL